MKEICIAAIGTRGDVLPALALADIFGKRSKIRILSSPDQVCLLRGKRYDCRAIGNDFAKVVGSRDIAYFQKQIEAQFESHLDVYKNADVIVGIGLFYAGRTLAEHFGKEYYHVFFTPQVLKSDQYAPAGMKRPFRGKLRNRLLWLKSSGESDFLLKVLINEKRKKFGLAPIRNVYQYFIDQPNTVIALDNRMVQIPKQYHSYIRQIHPLQYEDETPLSDALQIFLQKGGKPVLINFGSAEYAVMKLQELLKNTIHTVSALGYRIIVISQAMPDDYSRDDNIFTCTYAPHSKLLPNVKAIIHHGGIGTVYASLKCGIPQIIVPQAMDQFFWAEIISKERWGKAAYSDNRAFSSRLRQVVEETVNDPGISDNVIKMSSLMNSAPYREEGLRLLQAAMPACFAEENVRG